MWNSQQVSFAGPMWPGLSGLQACKRNLSHYTSPVGVSLLAMRPCQSTSLLTGLLLSRAGSLLQGNCACLTDLALPRAWSAPPSWLPGSYLLLLRVLLFTNDGCAQAHPTSVGAVNRYVFLGWISAGCVAPPVAGKPRRMPGKSSGSSGCPALAIPGAIARRGRRSGCA